jgi:hypothetical protein
MGAVTSTPWLYTEGGEEKFRNAVSLFQMRIARGDNRLDLDRPIVSQPFSNRFRIADERRTGGPTDKAQAGPEIGSDDQLVAIETMRSGQAALAFGIDFLAGRLPALDGEKFIGLDGPFCHAGSASS